MALYPERQSAFSSPTSTSTRDSGLRAYMLKIYNYMSGALLLTGLTAWMAAHSEAFLNAMYQIEASQIVGTKPLAWIIIFAPLALSIFLSFSIQRISLFAAQLSFWGYAALMGLSLSTILKRISCLSDSVDTY